LACAIARRGGSSERSEFFLPCLWNRARFAPRVTETRRSSRLRPESSQRPERQDVCAPNVSQFGG